MTKQDKQLETIVNHCKAKGFVYPGSEIYGGLANTWDYGPLGVLLKGNIKKAWKNHFIRQRTDMVELDASIFMNSGVWEASGHTAGFADCMVDDKASKHRFRADHLLEDQLGIDVEGWAVEQIKEQFEKNEIKNPNTGAIGDWTEPRYMNLMFETNRDKVGNDPTQKIYLRPETAQGIFVQFKNVLRTERRKLPFGIAQIGKAFRNEITPGNFMFRVVEFEQMEIEYFIKPPANDEEWNTKFEELLELQRDFFVNKLGVSEDKLKAKEHPAEKLSHYSKRTTDWEYEYPFGYSELCGLAYRTDFDLNAHQEASGQSLEYQDPVSNEKYIPHCIEPSMGVDRLFLTVMIDHYKTEELEDGSERVVMTLPEILAPYKIAALPLMKKDGLKEKAEEVFAQLRTSGVSAVYDESGSVGKRYRRQDEIGTPKCITIDHQTLEDGTVTVRDRDTMEQERVALSEII